ncbi:MAG: hypothetical protein K2X74_00315 [Acetobacteraceae bacterium]|nr:hypothetical protein [Acetobacteraceae bacterium]
MARRLLTIAALGLLPFALSGCVVAPAPGYYRPPTASVYVAPRPYYYRPYGYGYGYGRGHGYGRYGYWR